MVDMVRGAVHFKTDMRRYAGLLVLEQLARHASDVFYEYVVGAGQPDFLGLLFEAIFDTKVRRTRACVGVHVCIYACVYACVCMRLWACV